MAKKRREGASDKQRHGETCMCRRCRSRTEAMFYRKRNNKVKDYDYWDEYERTNYARGRG